MRKLNRDRLFSRNPDAMVVAAFETITAIQHRDPAEQVLGVALVFKEMTSALGLNQREVMVVIDRMEADTRNRDVNAIDALRQFVTHEIKAKLL